MRLLLQSASFRTKEDKQKQREDKKSSKKKGKCRFCFWASLLNYRLDLDYNYLLNHDEGHVLLLANLLLAIPALDFHNPGQDSRPALGLPFPICFWQGVWGYVSLCAHNEKRWSSAPDRGHAVLIHPSESWCEPSVIGRLFKIISTLGYTESWEVALANPQCSSPHQRDVLFCSQLCCLKKFLLSARKGWSIYSLYSLCVGLIKPPSAAGYFFSSLYEMKLWLAKPGSF